MTVENTISKTGKQVMGSKTYDFSFDVLLKDSTEEDAQKAVKCSIFDGETEKSLIYGKDYTVTLNPSRKGGKVTVTDPKDASWKIVVYRSYSPTQEADYNDFDSFPAETLEQCLDKVTMLIQEIKEELARCVKVAITDDQTPQALLDEVYDKLDSATEVAKRAITAANTANTAANNATAAVASAEKTLREVTTYVDTAKEDINNTKNSAIASVNNTKNAAETSISTTKDAAEANINKTKDDAISTINTTVSKANATIEKYVDDAEAEVRQIARDEANSAIAGAAEQATQTAKNNLNKYVDGTVKPSLQQYVDDAETAKSAAATSATSANRAAQAAKSSAEEALASEQRTKTSEDNVAKALEEALELTGYAEIFGGTPNDGTVDEIVGGYIQ